MSINESLNRPPKEEIAKRVSEAATGLATAAHAVAVENYAATQQAYNRRVEDDHRFGMSIAGMKPEDMVPSAPEGKKMGDIIVTGDVYGDTAVKALHRESASPARPPPAKPPGSTVLGKLVVAGSLLAGGAAAGVVANQLLSVDAPAAVDTDTATDVTFPD